MEQENREFSQFNIQILQDALYKVFHQPFLRDEVYDTDVVWKKKHRGPVVIMTGKKGMKMIRRSVGGYYIGDANIKKMRSICRKHH
jgi:hypothetical protein